MVNSSGSLEQRLLTSRRIGNPIVFLITALGGCMMIYSLSKIIENITNFPVMIELLITCIGTLAIASILCILIDKFSPCLAGNR
jgi:hypothetical protein